MFDSVSRKDYELAIQSAARAAAEAKHWRELSQHLVAQLADQQARHEHAVVDLLDRLQPKPAGAGPFFNSASAPQLSASQVRTIPAVGKRGIRERNALARALEMAEAEATQAAQRAQGRASLSAAEVAALDAQIIQGT